MSSYKVTGQSPTRCISADAAQFAYESVAAAFAPHTTCDESLVSVNEVPLVNDTVNGQYLLFEQQTDQPVCLDDTFLPPIDVTQFASVSLPIPSSLTSSVPLSSHSQTSHTIAPINSTSIIYEGPNYEVPVDSGCLVHSSSSVFKTSSISDSLSVSTKAAALFPTSSNAEVTVVSSELMTQRPLIALHPPVSAQIPDMQSSTTPTASSMATASMIETSCSSKTSKMDELALKLKRAMNAAVAPLDSDDPLAASLSAPSDVLSASFSSSVQPQSLGSSGYQTAAEMYGSSASAADVSTILRNAAVPTPSPRNLVNVSLTQSYPRGTLHAAFENVRAARAREQSLASDVVDAAAAGSLSASSSSSQPQNGFAGGALLSDSVGQQQQRKERQRPESLDSETSGDRLAQSCFASIRLERGAPDFPLQPEPEAGVASPTDDDLTNLSWLQNINIFMPPPAAAAGGAARPFDPNNNRGNHNQPTGALATLPANASSADAWAPAMPPPSFPYWPYAASGLQLNTQARRAPPHSKRHEFGGLGLGVAGFGAGGSSGGASSSKPPYSLTSLIFLAIESAPSKRLSVKGIYDWIVTRFPYYARANPGWRNSVRHNLSLSRCFVRVPAVGEASDASSASAALEVRAPVPVSHIPVEPASLSSPLLPLRGVCLTAPRFLPLSYLYCARPSRL